MSKEHDIVQVISLLDTSVEFVLNQFGHDKEGLHVALASVLSVYFRLSGGQRDAREIAKLILRIEMLIEEYK